MKSLVLLLAVLCLTLPVQARSGNEPLPPTLVVATWTTNGASVSWLPPVQEHADHPVTAYRIERLDSTGTLPTWTEIGSVAANTTDFLDPAATQGPDATYRVTSFNDAGPSFPSNPSSAMPLGGDDESPNRGIKLLFQGVPCTLIILGGPPNFVVIDDDCIPPINE
ncbi:MAG: fibronectin type III domain-containing protein [Candidatus Thermoplasmatota archaeon]|jgi:hypothetical protein